MTVSAMRNDALVLSEMRAAASVCGAGTLAGEVSTGLRDRPIQRLTMIEPAAGPTTPPQTKEASQERDQLRTSLKCFNPVKNRSVIKITLFSLYIS